MSQPLISPSPPSLTLSLSLASPLPSPGLSFSLFSQRGGPFDAQLIKKNGVYGVVPIIRDNVDMSARMHARTHSRTRTHTYHTRT